MMNKNMLARILATTLLCLSMQTFAMNSPKHSAEPETLQAKYPKGEVDTTQLLGKWQCHFTMGDDSASGQSEDEYFADGQFTSIGIIQMYVLDQAVNIDAHLKGKWTLKENNQLDYTQTKALSLKSNLNDEFDDMVKADYEQNSDTSNEMIELTQNKMVLKSLDPELSADFYTECTR